ncbi:MAG: glycosyltransferase family 39 protein [Planctomycetota bacterium]
MRPPLVTTAPPNATERAISRTEWLWLLGAVLFGAILRLGFPGRMAIEHFDEGVYASNFWFEVEQGGEYPARHLYAPPLLPMAIEWTMIVASLGGIKPTGFIPMIPSLMAGLATIPSMWWVGRRWFGPSAGIVAAWLVAASDFHASYSRAALTDVPVCLFMLWGVYFIWQALQTGTRRDILLAGLFTGLAWWTKYNGWLPLAIGLLGGAAWQLSLPRAERRLRQFATRWSLVALTAFAIWLPVLGGLQKYGGYAAVAVNHRQYLVGFAGWRSSAWRQLTVVGLYENLLGLVYEINDELSEQLLRKRLADPSIPPPPSTPTINLPAEYSWHWDRMLVAGKRTLSLATLPLLLILAVSGLTIGLVSDRRSARGLGLWLMAAWLAGMSFATPMYHPYPRLVMPWLMATWIGVGLGAELWWERGHQQGNSAKSHFGLWKPTWLELMVLVCLMGIGIVRLLVGTAHVWRDRGQFQLASYQIAERIQSVTHDSGFSPHEAVVYVIGEPAIVNGLRSHGLPYTAPVQDLRFVSSPQIRPTFLVFSRRTFQNASFADEWDGLRNRFTPVLIPQAHKSHLVRFDETLKLEEIPRLDDHISSTESFYSERLTD